MKITKKKKLVYVLFAVALLMVAGGVSYAAYNYNFLSNANTISTGELKLEFLESDDNVISLPNAVPMSDNDGKNQDQYFDFAVTSETAFNYSLKYILSIEKLSADTGYTFLEDSAIKVYLEDLDGNVLLEPTKVSDLSNSELYTGTHAHSSSAMRLQDKYRLRVWIDESKEQDAESWNLNTKLQYKFRLGLDSFENNTNKYLVYFNDNGGTGGQKAKAIATYNENMPAITSVAPTKEGYTFMGWYDNPTYTSGVQYYTSTGTSARTYNKTSSTTLYAGWKINTYTLTLNPNSGTYNSTTSNTTIAKNYNLTSVINNNATRTGYVFGGWKNSSSFDATTTDGTFTNNYGMIKYYDSSDLYKRYLINSLTATKPSIHNNSGGGSVTFTNQVDSTSSTGYSMKIITNGTASPGAGGLYNGITASAGAVYYHKVVAKIPVGYNIELASNSRGVGSDQYWLTDRAGTGDWKTYVNVTYCGYAGTFSTFGHIYLSSTNTTNYPVTNVTWYVNESTMYKTASDLTELQATSATYTHKNNATYTARWSIGGAISYFYPNGGTFDTNYVKSANGYGYASTSIASRTYYYGTNYGTFPANNSYNWTPDNRVISKTGYTFNGWNTNESGTGTTLFNADGTAIASTTIDGTAVTDASKGWKDYTKNLTLYAKWQVNTYTINATVVNGTITGDTSKTVNYNTPASFNLNPTIGYGNGTISCTNGQTGTLENNVLTVSNVTENTTCTVTYRKIPNPPELSENMIPVYYDDDAEVWKKADSTNNNPTYKWYDYDNKMWANSVTVSSTNRDTYKASDPGTPIPMSDILTMQVWIPRYKYKVWNYNLDGTVSSSPQEIDIRFEEGTDTTGEITCEDNIQGEDGDGTSEVCQYNGANCTDATCNGKTYTHPAFTFGDEEVEGIWVGKFESSSNTACTVSSSSAIGAGCNLTTIKPLVKPDVTAWRGAMVSVFENNTMAMNDTNNIYGFASSDDTHVMKNMEWGAVAYLSHSKYGVNREVYINNSSGYYIGRSGGNVGGSTPINETYSGQTSTTEYNAYGYYTYDGYLLEYNTNTKSEAKDMSKVGSTTGNIYGIYDMSGGSYEYVMGNIVSIDGTTMMSGYNTSNNHSGYTGILYDSVNYTSYTGTYSYPNNKYFDKYSFGTSVSQRQRSKLGDALKEVYNTGNYGWNSDYNYLAYNSRPWFLRGGSSYNGADAGLFGSLYYYGDAYSGSASRFSITP